LRPGATASSRSRDHRHRNPSFCLFQRPRIRSGHVESTSKRENAEVSFISTPSISFTAASLMFRCLLDGLYRFLGSSPMRPLTTTSIRSGLTFLSRDSRLRAFGVFGNLCSAYVPCLLRHEGLARLLLRVRRHDDRTPGSVRWPARSPSSRGHRIGRALLPTPEDHSGKCGASRTPGDRGFAWLRGV